MYHFTIVVNGVLLYTYILTISELLLIISKYPGLSGSHWWILAKSTISLSMDASHGWLGIDDSWNLKYGSLPANDFNPKSGLSNVFSTSLQLMHVFVFCAYNIGDSMFQYYRNHKPMVVRRYIFCLILAHIGITMSLKYVKWSCLTWSRNQKNIMLISWQKFCFASPIKIPVSEELSFTIGVAGLEWKSSSNNVLSTHYTDSLLRYYPVYLPLFMQSHCSWPWIQCWKVYWGT